MTFMQHPLLPGGFALNVHIPMGSQIWTSWVLKLPQIKKSTSYAQADDV